MTLALFYICFFLLFVCDIQVLPLFFDLNMYFICVLPFIYYWAIYHPTLLPAPLLMACGLLKDLILGYPLLGLSAFIYIAVHMLVRPQRTFLAGQNFFMIWAGYLFITTLSTSLFFTATALKIGFGTISKESFLFEAGIMGLAFPLVFFMMGLLHKIMPFGSSNANTL